ncbi:MAG: hypothetical protein ACRDBX_05650 [Erysipelotrichaceae bacterium]
MKTTSLLHQIDEEQTEQKVKVVLDWYRDICLSGRYDLSKFIALTTSYQEEGKGGDGKDAKDLIDVHFLIEEEWENMLIISNAILRLKPNLRFCIVRRFMENACVEEIRVVDPSYYAHLKTALRHLGNLLGLNVYTSEAGV